MARPTVSRPSKPAADDLSFDDLFEALSENAETVDQKQSKSKNVKPNVDLAEDEVTNFEAFCAADIVYKMAEGKQKAAKGLIIPILRRKLIEKWTESGKKTENPVIQTGKARANFVVRNILKFELNENEDGTTGSIRDRLLEEGFSEDEANEIFEKNVRETVEMNFRPLNELRNGNAEAQGIAKKLLKLVRANFSPEEQKFLLRKETNVEIDEDFIKNAISYVGEDVEKLDTLLTVIHPQWVLSHMTYSGADLKKAVADLTGGELSTVINNVKAQEFYSADKLWKAVAKGDEATLYACVNGVEALVGTKKCSGGSDHAISTCKKLVREEDYRNRFPQ